MIERGKALYKLDPDGLRAVLPDGPGVYLFKDTRGRIIYVGKAKNLKKRVFSYLKPPADLPLKTALMMRKAGGLGFILTTNEKEAFILESNLIKKHIPRYNIVLRDDKQYPCLRLDIQEPYPRLTIVRKIKKDGALYFGPFSSANAVRSTVKVIDRVFQLRKCKGRKLPKRSRPCLNYQLGRCLGACTRPVPVAEYGDIIRQVKLFLKGRNRELVDQLKRDMAVAAEGLDFEKAARIRDQIRNIEKTIERQRIVSPKLENQDVIGLAAKDGFFQVVVFFVRRGCVIGTRDYLFRDEAAHPPEVMEAFIKQYYNREAFIPGKIILSETIEDASSIMAWLSDLAGRKVKMHKPVRGEKLKMVDMVLKNAENLLDGRIEREKEDLIALVQKALDLKNAPRWIEGLDISNLQGSQAVGTVVSFLDGQPHRAGYRNYRIKTIEGIDDYGMMAEMVSRRLSKGNLPDLFLVDGGKGHLAAVKRILDAEAGPAGPDVVSLAKPDENLQENMDKIYVPGRKNPVPLAFDSPVLLLMMRVRDEAHRRAVTYHRKLRKRNLYESELDAIPGIGRKRKQNLLKYFNRMDDIAHATTDQLMEVPGINKLAAQHIFSYFNAQVSEPHTGP